MDAPFVIALVGYIEGRNLIQFGNLREARKGKGLMVFDKNPPYHEFNYMETVR